MYIHILTIKCPSALPTYTSLIFSCSISKFPVYKSYIFFMKISKFTSKTSKIDGMWSQSDIKLPMYGRIIKLRYYFLFVGKVSIGSLSWEISTFLISKLSLVVLGSKIPTYEELTVN